MSRAPLPPLNFEALARALLSRARELVPRWLSGGEFKPSGGAEYFCGSVFGGAGSSCAVNCDSGLWSDFQTGESGRDLISLYAASNELSMGKAARQLAQEEGFEDDLGMVHRPGGPTPPPPPRPPPPPPAPKAEPEGWRTVRPVPPRMPAPTFKHHHRRPEDVEHTAEYRTGDDLHGFVVRFRTSDGGKDPLPYTWCMSARDGGSRWHWKQWDEPRPLYLPSHALPGTRTVVLVEGEKKGDTLHHLLEEGAPGIYCVASWPGGCKAWKKADWSWLAGTTVILWPDCDAKRESLTGAERKAHPDKGAQEVLKQSKPLLPANEQSGMAAMLGIGALLRDEHACTVQLLPIPEPGAVVDGWDCGNAINEDGWSFDRVQSFFGQAQPLPADASSKAPAGPPAASGGARPPAPPPARESLVGTEGEEDDRFAQHLDFLAEQGKCNRWDLVVNRKLLIKALRTAPALEGVLGFDELRSAPATRRPLPWREDFGPLGERDDLRLGDYLSTEYQLKAAGRAALTEALETVADENRFHPVRDWLGAQVHDGKTRIDKWLIYALRFEPDKLQPKFRRYLELMGRYLLMGLVARVMDPGCKFDYAPVFEGLTGKGKSTLVATLVGADFFSDTHFDIGSGKDGMEQLDGLWAYELSEMTAFRRADSEQVKQFFSSRVDRFRGAYGKYVQPHPRQCIIFCTTNKRQYLYDLTGNRRFWPVWCSQPILIEWVEKMRGQLFAEALALYQAGERYTPTREEEDLYFIPEQDKRLVETAVQSRLYELLTREGAPQGDLKASVGLNELCTFVTINQLVQALGADAAKSTTALEGQIRSWLEAMGWEPMREKTGQRRRGFKQPTPWPPEIHDPPDDLPAQAEGPDGGDDDHVAF